MQKVHRSEQRALREEAVPLVALHARLHRQALLVPTRHVRAGGAPARKLLV